MSSFAAPKITMPVDGYADPPTCFAMAGGAQWKQWTAYDRIEPDRVRTYIRHASVISMISRALRCRPSAASSQSRGSLGVSCGKTAMSGHSGALTRWHGRLSWSQKLQDESIAESRTSFVDLFLASSVVTRVFMLQEVTNHP